MNFYHKNEIKSCATLFSTVFLFAFLFFVFQSNVAMAATVTPRILISGDPGQTVSDEIKLVNEQKESKTYYITFANFESADESGNPHFSDRKEDLASWLTAESTISVGPGDSAEIPFTINIPQGAAPGGHFAAIFFQTDPPVTADTPQVGVNTKLGSLIYLTVSGDFEQGANVLEFGSTTKQHFFTSLPVTFYYRFQNTGEEHLKPVGDILIRNTIGRLSKILTANPVDGTVLPKSIRRFETTWASGFGPLQEEPNPQIQQAPKGFWNNVNYELHNFAFGRYSATLKVVFGVNGLQSTNATFDFYVIPWHLLLVIFIALLIVLIIGRFFLRRYNRYIISKATRPPAVVRTPAVKRVRRKPTKI